MSFNYHRDRLTYGVDLANSTGIEIGPLINPMVSKEVSDVRYVDRASTEDLQEWYAKDPTIDVNQIMHIDYVWGEQSLAQVIGGTEEFDYCIASHVIEHIPDLITWLFEIASILKNGGVACFAVPDKRYTFDYLRPETTTADLVESYFQKLRKPSIRHIYDHFSNFAHLDVNVAWGEGFDGSTLVPLNTSEKVYNTCRNAQIENKYVDSHCSVFTQESFFNLLRDLSELGLLDFKIKSVFSTRPGMFEFFVQLEKIDSNLSKDTKLDQFENSYKEACGAVLEIEMICDKPCKPRIYYDMGNGFTEIETQEAQYHKANVSQLLRYRLPITNASALRFDPADNEVSLVISNIDYSEKNVSIDSITPLIDIAKCKKSRNKLRAKSVLGAKDPAFLITI